MAPMKRWIELRVTGSGTLVFGIPKGHGTFDIKVYRPYGPPAERLRCFSGVMLSVRRLAPGEPVAPEREYVLNDRRYEALPGTYGHPLVGERMFIGDPASHREVTTPVAGAAQLDVEHEWLVDALMRQGPLPRWVTVPPDKARTLPAERRRMLHGDNDAGHAARPGARAHGRKVV